MFSKTNVKTLNINVFCGFFRIYPRYVLGILNTAKQIQFYVLCIKKVNYGYYTENVLCKTVKYYLQNTVF